MKRITAVMSGASLILAVQSFAAGQLSESIPWSEIGAAATAEYKGDGLQVSGTRLDCALQRLIGEATPNGLWLSSTAPASSDRFSVRAAAYGRTAMTSLPMRGSVEGRDGLAQWNRSGIVEEYSVSADGVRQDFIIDRRPGGSGPLRVELDVAGARVEPAVDGAQLVLDGSGRKLAYNRLFVTDAAAQHLIARLEVVNASTLAVIVDDTNAVYPIRIDPTFSDADWMSLGEMPGADSDVYAVIADGAGNLYIGGKFTAAGSVAANRVAKWDGSSWTALGAGMNHLVHALALDSLGNLYAGGYFTEAGGSSADYIAKWDGTSWSSLGSGMSGGVLALEMDGSDNLYAGGSFFTAGGISASRIAKWDGSVWSPLGSGMNTTVNALALDGSDNLYAGGDFSTAGGISALKIAKWDGSAWSALGTGTDSSVFALAVDGSDHLYVGGAFGTAGGISAGFIAKWDGSVWSALGLGMDSTVRALGIDGAGDLYAGGFFTKAWGVSGTARIAKWDGSVWSGVGGGMNNRIWALALDSVDHLYAGGEFISAGEIGVSRIAKWDGSTWSGFGSGMNATVWALTQDAAGNLYAAGDFTTAGGGAASRIAKWDGSTWSPLGLGLNNTVRALVADGAGNLYAGGLFTTAGGATANYIAKWDGNAWSAFGQGVNFGVFALVLDSTGNLYVGGQFSLTGGGLSVNRIAKWDGSVWSALGTGMNSSVNDLVLDSTGNLYACGVFTTAGGISANRIAKWDGSTWTALGSGMGSEVWALEVDASDDLYAGGYFNSAGGVSANYIAKWNGSAWSALGSGLNDTVFSLKLDGDDNLYAGGRFTLAGGNSANRIAKWNGSAWSPLGSGINNYVRALAIEDSQTLYAGGSFSIAGTEGSGGIAKATIGIDLLVANLTAGQRAGTKWVDIYYDVSSVTTNTVTTTLEIANGVTPISPVSLTGDIGSGVLTGTMKHIIWDADADWSGNLAELEFTLYATDGPITTPATASVAKTGQTISYATGDDGDLKTGVEWPSPRFTETVNNTAFDNLTGLEWVLDPAQMAGNSNPMSWSNAVVFCDNDTYQGGGWRLPSYKEMLSLVDFNNEAPALPPGHPFLGIDSVNYWTGSTSTWNSPTNAFTLYVGAGSVGASDKNNGGKVWPVRGGLTSSPAPVPQTGQTTSYQPHDDGDLKTGASWPSPHFSDLGDGVVRDNLTGLEWANQPHSLVGNTATLNWSNAVAFCESLNHGSTQDWRLPNVKELESIITLNPIGAVNWLNSAETPFNGILQNNYWTGTTKAGSTSRAWIVNTYIFGVSHVDKTSPIRVWPVRTGAPGVALPTGISAFSDTDSRDYSLSVSSPFGTPIPGNGTASIYAWRSAITASVDGVVSAGGTNYTCSGWNGTGSVPNLGSGTNAGPIVLTTVSSSIDWRWIVDADSDQMPDDWELLYYGSSTGAVATADTDGDGYNAWQEYILGSNPTNGGSSFLFTPSPSQPTNTAFSVDFTTVTGRLYTVECTDELGSGNWQVLTNFIGDGSAVQLIDPANIPACFYQVRIDWVE